MQSTQNSLLFTDLSEATQESINGGYSISISTVGSGSASKSIAFINGKEVSPDVAKAEFAKSKAAILAKLSPTAKAFAINFGF